MLCVFGHLLNLIKLNGLVFTPCSLIESERLLACSRRKHREIEDTLVIVLTMDDEPKRPVAMSLTELNSCEDDAMDHGFRPVFEADDIQV